MNGGRRTALPVSLRTAFATAGPIGGVPGSPTPVGDASEAMIAHLDLRHLMEFQRRVVMEVRLRDDAAGLQREFV